MRLPLVRKNRLVPFAFVEVGPCYVASEDQEEDSDNDAPSVNSLARVRHEEEQNREPQTEQRELHFRLRANFAFFGDAVSELSLIHI